ncbi:winged helix-turn-helix domain-containing protein [Spirosoma radiotolerans]|uniref:Transcriptional regulator n=1 Tax=Spirosoma radiotolerans TaxID=1379870 RepID=A0A0E3V7T7_9BACT|nr:winged helix-turn-helix domain-containing protein [Spirosoma radiotolerans]AKD55731.1 transcriptional regulator [Spirosoma radiotolerans]
MRVYSGLPTVFRLLIVSGIILMISLLFARFVGPSSNANQPYTPEKVNLALRRTLHHLLRAAGDSTSRIPAVQQLDSKTYRVQIDHAFDYGRLPALLQESFRLHKVAGEYTVAVLDCANGKVQVGYSVKDILDHKSVPCVGRSITSGCYLLQVTFDEATEPAQPVPFWPVLSIGGMIVSLLVAGWHRKERTSQLTEPAPSSTVPTSLLQFGRSSLDVNNQILTTDTCQHNLTYRETKLLRLLVNHPNQVLERDLILKLVWEDEGIIVGRSVDVFISRLRKLLQSDSTIRIAAVHGVGYRLEVQEVVRN